MAYQPNAPTNFYNPGMNGGGFMPQTSASPMFTPPYNQFPTFQPQQSYVQQQTAPQIRPVNGRIVSSENDITPNDVPMDNSVSLFPTEDYSCIFAKQWTSDGKIKTIRFVPVENEDDYTPSVSFEEEIRGELAEIKKLLTRPKKPYHKKQYRQVPEIGNQAGKTEE